MQERCASVRGLLEERRWTSAHSAAVGRLHRGPVDVTGTCGDMLKSPSFEMKWLSLIVWMMSSVRFSFLRERRQALITAAVTGQIDVATARGTAL